MEGILTEPPLNPLCYICTLTASMDTVYANLHVKVRADFQQQNIALERAWREEGVELTVQEKLPEKLEYLW